MATITVKDSAGADVVIEKPLAPGRAAAAASRPVALSNEDAAFLDGIEGKLDSLITGIAAANTSLDNIEAAAVDTTTDSPVTIHQPCDVVPFTPTLDTAIYAAGDVLFATAPITLARANDGRVMLQSLTVMDKSKQKPAFSIFFYKTNVTSAAANAANNLSDADAVNYLGHISIAAADYKDLANNSFLTYAGGKAPGLLLEAATGAQTVYAIGILDAGTPTFAVGDLVLGLGVIQS